MSISPYGLKFQPVDINGSPYPGAMLYCLAAGTNWPAGAQQVYSDAGYQSAISNPIVADATGTFQAFYLDDTKTYKFQLTDAAGNVLRTDDNVGAGAGAISGVSATSTPAMEGANSGTGAGVEGLNTGTGYGVIASATVANPVKSALRIVPQNAAPTSPVKGDVRVDATNGRIYAYDGTKENEYVVMDDISGVGSAKRTIKTTGNYTPTAKTQTAIIILHGGGGGGAGANGNPTGTPIVAAGSGGASGGVSIITVQSPSGTYACAYGAAGAGGAGTSPGHVGGNGGDTTIVVGGTTYIAKGGGGGLMATCVASLLPSYGVAGGVPQTGGVGDTVGGGQNGSSAFVQAYTSLAIGGSGGNDQAGTGGAGATATSGNNTAGGAADGLAAGGGGAASSGSNTGAAGGAGGAGYIEIIEFF